MPLRVYMYVLHHLGLEIWQGTQRHLLGLILGVLVTGGYNSTLVGEWASGKPGQDSNLFGAGGGGGDKGGGGQPMQAHVPALIVNTPTQTRLSFQFMNARGNTLFNVYNCL